MASNWIDRRVVVTGLGVVTPLGHQLDVFWNNLVSGQCGIDRITAFDATPFDTQIAGEVKNFDPLPAFPSPKEVRRTDRYSQFGIFAGHQALLDSGLDLEPGKSRRNRRHHRLRHRRSVHHHRAAQNSASNAGPAGSRRS